MYGEAPQKIELLNSNVDVNDDDNKDSDEINWDISEVNEIDFNYEQPLEESGIVVEVVEQESNVAKGNEAYTVLDNPKTRDEFISQLMEVRIHFDVMFVIFFFQ